jgi:hypothetical protein
MFSCHLYTHYKNKFETANILLLFILKWVIKNRGIDPGICFAIRYGPARGRYWQWQRIHAPGSFRPANLPRRHNVKTGGGKLHPVFFAPQLFPRLATYGCCPHY